MSGARMEQAWQVLMQGRKEGERTLDVSEARVKQETGSNVGDCEQSERVAMGSNVWKMHDIGRWRGEEPQEGKASRRGTEQGPQGNCKVNWDERPTQASDEAEQKARTARGHRSKDGGHASSERKTPRTGVASKVEGDGPTR